MHAKQQKNGVTLSEEWVQGVAFIIMHIFNFNIFRIYDYLLKYIHHLFAF